jgi:hypothetical protein
MSLNSVGLWASLWERPWTKQHPLGCATTNRGMSLYFTTIEGAADLLPSELTMIVCLPCVFKDSREFPDSLLSCGKRVIRQDRCSFIRVRKLTVPANPVLIFPVASLEVTVNWFCAPELTIFAKEPKINAALLLLLLPPLELSPRLEGFCLYLFRPWNPWLSGKYQTSVRWVRCNRRRVSWPSRPSQR